MAVNLQRLQDNPYPPVTAENLAAAFRLSLSDCVIPAALEPRFSRAATEPPVFRPERNVLGIFLQPETLLPPDQLARQALCPGPRAAPLRFADTRAGCLFDDAYVADLAEARPLLHFYPGVVYLYLDDYSQYCRLGPFRAAPVFFRADVPWNDFGAELTSQGFRIERAFLLRYTDSVCVFFGFDRWCNVVFSMLAHWEIGKIRAAFASGALTRCSPSDDGCCGPHPWWAYRDLIAAVTEDRAYGRMDADTFRRQRLL